MATRTTKRAAPKSSSGGLGSRALVIVESPTKAKTIRGFLPAGFTVAASMGHVRDLPRKADEIPPKYKDQKWAKFGVNVDEDFEPLYIVTPDKKGHDPRAQGAAQGRRRPLPRDRRRPRGGEHLVAPARGAAAEGAGASDGVPRDHQGGDPRRARPIRATSTRTWCMRRRPDAFSIAWSATPSRRFSGTRSAATASRPAACSRWRCG